MTIYAPNIEGRSGPKYRMIASAIADDISSGKLATESKLPPQRELAWQLGVTVGTVSRAYAEIAQRGLVHGEVGRGTFVRGSRFEAGEAAPASAEIPGYLDMTRNAPGAGPGEGMLAATLAKLSRGDLGRLLDYQVEGGPLDQRDAGARWLARVGLTVPPDRIIVTSGAQDALALAIVALTRPGDTVLAESLIYCQFRDAVRFLGRRIRGLAMDQDGVLPEALEVACHESGARIVYLTPTLQNPTNVVMSEERRRAIARIAEQHDLLIIEDDVYGHLIEDRPPTLAALAPHHTIHVTSVSKALAPGLRVGWAAAPAAHIARLAEAQRVTAVCPPPLTGEVVRLWIEDGSANTLIQWLRTETRARYEMAREYLAGWSLRAHPASFHLLLELPPAWPSETFASAARERGVGVLPASAFATEPGNGDGTLRLSLSQPPSRAALGRALGVLRELLGTLPAGRPAII